MPGPDVAQPIGDPALPALAVALDGGAMLPRIAGALGTEARDARCAVEVLSHKPGSRATLRYTVEGAAPPASAVAKIYREASLAEQAFLRLRALGDALPDASLPHALALLPDLGMFVQEHIDAPDVRHALAGGNGEQPLVLAARFLARLHAAPPLRDLETLSIAHELGKVAQWLDQIEAELPERGASLRATGSSLRKRAPTRTEQPSSMVHKDFYYAHVLWDGARISVVDFDELQRGDPAFDAGHFVAHLANLAYRQTGRAGAYAREGEAFLTAYESAAPADVRDRLPFYQAYTFVKLAATETSRKRGDWRTRAALLSDLAAQALA